LARPRPAAARAAIDGAMPGYWEGNTLVLETVAVKTAGNM